LTGDSIGLLPRAVPAFILVAVVVAIGLDAVAIAFFLVVENFCIAFLVDDILNTFAAVAAAKHISLEGSLNHVCSR